MANVDAGLAFSHVLTTKLAIRPVLCHVIIDYCNLVNTSTTVTLRAMHVRPTGGSRLCCIFTITPSKSCDIPHGPVTVAAHGNNNSTSLGQREQ